MLQSLCRLVEEHRNKSMSTPSFDYNALLKPVAVAD
jgi:hypothetical protein